MKPPAPFTTGEGGAALARHLEKHGAARLARWTGVEVNRLRLLAFIDGAPEPEERTALADFLGIPERAWEWRS